MNRAALLALAFVGLSPPGWSCSCVEPLPVEDAVAHATVVFVGRTVSLGVEKRMQDGHEIEVVVCRFDVSEGFKGLDAGATQVTLLTPAQGGACGFPFRIWTRYLVYASEHDGSLQTNTCQRTKPLVRYTTGDEFTPRTPQDPVDDSGLQEADLVRELVRN